MSISAKAKFMIRQLPFIVPKKIIDSCRDWIDSQKNKKGIYFSQRGHWYKTIFPKGFLHHAAPQTLGEPNEKAFYPNSDYPTGEAALFYLQNAYLLGHKGFVLTIDHQVFQEFSHHFGISSIKKFFWKNPFYIFSKSAKHIDGVAAVLVSPESHNYYHWLSDVLPRIKLYEEVFDKIDHFCIASNVPSKFVDMLGELGIPKEKLLFIGEKEKLHFDHLYVSSLPGSEGRSPVWAADYIRDKLLITTGKSGTLKKLYFKRGDTTERKILNEGQIVKLLQDKGFEIVDPGALSVTEQIALMTQASVVIGAHGAALSNLLFSNEGTKVIEIFSPDYFRTDCYYTLASILKLNYWYVVGDKPAGAGWGDIVVSEELLIKTIEHTDGK